MLLVDRILFMDGESIVLDKPQGLPVDAPRDGSLSVHSHLSSLAFGFKRWPTPVHRLDTDTSGCLLLARNPGAHKRFQKAFEGALVEKLYLAVIEGVPDGEGGSIIMPLGKVSSKEAGWRVVPDARGKSAITRWRKMGEQNGRALIQFIPETGRTHQIRVHAASGLGFPIVGDPHYGNGEGAMLLHASALYVERNGKPDISVHAPLPERFGDWPLLPGLPGTWDQPG